jgi:hypothetical protein
LKQRAFGSHHIFIWWSRWPRWALFTWEFFQPRLWNGAVFPFSLSINGRVRRTALFDFLNYGNAWNDLNCFSWRYGVLLKKPMATGTSEVPATISTKLPALT